MTPVGEIVTTPQVSVIVWRIPGVRSTPPIERIVVPVESPVSGVSVTLDPHVEV
jgi:hypothetical protein